MAKFSLLQRYILRQGYLAGSKIISKTSLLKYYEKKSFHPQKKDAVNILSKSIDRLIERGLVVGYGYKTAEKLFIISIKLTPNGRKNARQLMGMQQKLPFKNN